MSFFAQGDAEKKRGKAPPPFMDREVSTTYKISADFSRFVGRPLFENLQKFASPCSKVVDMIDQNLEILQKLQEGEDEAKIPELEMDFVIHPDHSKVEDFVLKKRNNMEIRVMNLESNSNQKVNNMPLRQNPRPQSRLQRGATTPSTSNLTFDFDGVFELDGELSPSDHFPSGLSKSWVDQDEFGTSLPSTPSV